MRWRHWGSTYAVGWGRQWYNTCKPYCAAGNYLHYRVRVRLDLVKVKNGHRYYSRMRVYRPDRAPHHQSFPTPTP